MFSIYFYILLLLVSTLQNVFSANLRNSGRFIFVNETYVFGKQYIISVNSSVEYVLHYSMIEQFFTDYPARITVSTYDADLEHPVFVTARQQQSVLSWQLPMLIGEWEMKNVSRTLCPNEHSILEPNSPDRNDKVQFYPIIHLYTSSDINVTIVLTVDRELDFNLQFNKEKHVIVSPAKPVVFYYSFTKGISGLSDDNYDGGVVEMSMEEYFNRQKQLIHHYSGKLLHELELDETKRTVLVHITSTDDTCMLMSIQNATCPLFDTERELTYEGFYATISNQGGIAVTKQRYPNGFYIVLVVKTDDKDCIGTDSYKLHVTNRFSDFFNWRSKEFDSVDTFQVTNQLTREKLITITILGSVSYQEYIQGLIVLSVVIVAIYLIVLIAVGLYHKKMSSDATETLDIAQPEDDQLERHQPNGQSVLDIATNNYGIRTRDTESVDGQIDQLEEKIYLNELCTRDSATLRKQSNMFLWHLITVSIFYGLPVVQLVITYQRVLNQTGNQDQCYYNFLCAHPWGFFSDFNHIYSNIGYVFLGLLFIIIVWRRKKMHENSELDENYGIPQHYGLYYAMGGGLIMEGILSASYHVCPNHTNFQFDTSFMYVIAVLCMVKIYQSRHPDVNARAHVTFGVLSATVFVGLIGVLFPNLYFWLFFTIVHISTCLMLSLHIYYMGRFKIELICCKECVCGGICRPALRSRCLMVLIANLCNWSLAGVGLYNHSKDFASHLLYLFLMNLGLYMFWYLIMKLLHKERPKWYCWVLFFMASLTWAGSLVFFTDKSTSWSLTPAQSRTFNKQCALLNFYDNHDIWHMLSAGAMFFSFMLFLTMDDDVRNLPRYKIPVF